MKNMWYQFLMWLLKEKFCKLMGGHPANKITKWKCRDYQPMVGDYDPNTLVWDRKCLQCGESISWEFYDDPNEEK